jgi:hypothetical protein
MHIILIFDVVLPIILRVQNGMVIDDDDDDDDDDDNDWVTLPNDNSISP